MDTQKEPLTEGTVKKAGGKKFLRVTGIVIAALVVVYAGLCAISFAGNKTVANVSVLGVNMGRMTQKQANEIWTEKQESTLKDTSIALVIDGEEVKQVSLKDLGVTISADTAVDAAWAINHGNFFTAGFEMVRGWVSHIAVMPKMERNDTTFEKTVQSLVKELDIKQIDGSYRIDEKAKDCFYITKSADGRAIQQEKLQKDLIATLDSGELNPVTCEYTVVPGKKVDVKAIDEKIRHKPVNAKYDKETGGLTEERIGVVFDTDEAQKCLDAAADGKEFAVPATIKHAKVTRAELEKVLFKDVLGSYTTCAGGTSARLNNVALATRSINGCVLNSGEEFWYNAALGERTAAAGYQAAPAYVGGNTVDQLGGGICQVSSTLYYATLLSNLDIVCRCAHQFAPSYITFGCDATVSWGGPDFAFKNNTDYPIKIVASFVNNNVSVTIYGTKTDNSYVRMVSETVSSKPYKTITKKTADLPAGVTQWEQTGYTGYTVKTYRNVYAGDGTLLSSNFEDSSVYSKRDAIELVGTKVTSKPKEEKKTSESQTPEATSEAESNDTNQTTNQN